MKRLFLSAALCALLGGTASAQFGNCTPSEKTTYVDAQTGRTITVLTDTLQNDRFLYQTDPMWTSTGSTSYSALPPAPATPSSRP